MGPHANLPMENKSMINIPSKNEHPYPIHLEIAFCGTFFNVMNWTICKLLIQNDYFLSGKEKKSGEKLIEASL